MSYVNNPIKYIGNIVKEYKQWNNAVGRKMKRLRLDSFGEQRSKDAVMTLKESRLKKSEKESVLG